MICAGQTQSHIALIGVTHPTQQTALESDTAWMQLALAQAELAQADGEVPVGAVVVLNGHVIGAGYNTPVQSHDPTAHAEMNALREAARNLGNYRLEDCELFVTLEPCTMCAGAMLHARLKRVVFGAIDPKTGAAGSVLNVFDNPKLNHQTLVTGSVQAEPCANLLKVFFKSQRAQQHLAKAQKGGALREDALRTPEHCFESGVNTPGVTSGYVSDLPSLAGLRLHFLDAGPDNASKTLFCLHGHSSWSEQWREAIPSWCAQGHRVICPDLIGFGRSDKPKKESFHQLAWHAQVLVELLDHFSISKVTLVVPDDVGPLVECLVTHHSNRIDTVVEHNPDNLSPFAMKAPYPDAGHCAAPRAFKAFQTPSPKTI